MNAAWDWGARRLGDRPRRRGAHGSARHRALPARATALASTSSPPRCSATSRSSARCSRPIPAKRDELGPHGIPLVEHARAGGADARAVLELLETDGGRRDERRRDRSRHGVADAAAHLYVWALKDIPQDLRDALAEAAGRETSVTGQRVLQTILRNVTGRRGREEPRLPGHRHRRLLLPRRRALPAPPGADLRGAQGRHRARDGRASAALEHRAHAHAREHRAERRLPRADRPLGLRPRLGRPRRQVRPEGLGLREHELPEDVRPRRRREGDQEVRARVDRRRGRQAVPAGDRRRRDRRLGRLRDVPRQGGDRAAGRHAQPGPARRAARGRALRAPERDRHRADGPRRRRDRALRATSSTPTRT